MPEIHEYARRYVEGYNFALVPLRPRSKSAAIRKKWQEPGNQLITPDAATAHWQQHPQHNMGAHLGASNLCSLDIDELEYAKRIFSNLYGIDLEQWAKDYPTIQGKPERYRIMFRAPAGVKLSSHSVNWPDKQGIKTTAGSVKQHTVFELRAGNVQDVLPPSIHPDTGEAYNWLTPPKDGIPDLPDEILRMWQNWDITKRDALAACPWAEKPKNLIVKSSLQAGRQGASVIDAYNKAHNIEAMLAQHGYKQIGQRWLSPHSSTGMPGINIFEDDNKLFCHHASDPLHTEKHRRDAFDVYKILEHNGDQHTAVKAAAKTLDMDYSDAIADTSDFSELELGKLFVEKYGVGFRFVAKSGVFWYDGKRWVADDRKRAFSCAEIIQRDVARELSDHEKRRIKSKATRNALLDFAFKNQRLVMLSHDFERDRHRLNTTSGAVNLKTGEIEPSKPEDYFLHVTRCGYSTDRPNRFLRFLDEIFGGDKETIDFIRRVFGYCITGEICEQKLFFCYGEGANGKSVLLDLVNWMLASYAINYPASALMKQKHESHPTDLALLEGKRLAISAELERSQHWAESRIKELTGTETITARKMRQDFYEFPVTSKHIVCGNYEPALQGGDSAMQRRMIQVRFNQTIAPERRDPKLLDKLKDEADAIMGWLVQGACQWYQGGLRVPVAVKRDSEEYFASMDDIGLWLEECCDITGRDTDWTDNKELYQSYKEWKIESGSKPLANNNWGREMGKRGVFHSKKERGQRGYAGIIKKYV